jgi:hypothetical protein
MWWIAGQYSNISIFDAADHDRNPGHPTNTSLLQDRVQRIVAEAGRQA